jgi:imidazolonepropionase
MSRATPTRFALRAARIVTCDPARAAGGNALGALDDAALVVSDGRVEALVPARDVPPGVPCEDVTACAVTPGLVDAHTHACWVGSRHAEYAIRLAGGDYRAIAAAGGGIVSTYRAVADASEDALTDALVARLRRMARLGVTTCEVKSGYGLEPDHERKQLRAIARAARAEGVPHVVPTFLALHAIPPGMKEQREAFVSGAVALVSEVAAEGLARFVDAYVDENAFTVEEARRVCVAARASGLSVRLHVGQFADVRGAELAAEVSALTADHLEHVSDEAIAALARAGTHAVLLPIASFTLNQAPPPVEALRRGGVPLVVASDANPGTAPSESLPLAMALAVRQYGLTPDEAIAGATRLAARSLGLERGVLAEGACADFVVWDLPHETAIVQPWGTTKARAVYREGVRIA